MKRKGPDRADQSRQADDFQQQAEQTAPGLIFEFIDFARHNKKWWLIPIVVVLLILGVLVALQATGMAWALYTVF
jgi:hypothetical protein